MKLILAFFFVFVVLTSCATTEGPQDKGFFLGQCDVDLTGQVARIVFDRYEGHAVAIQLVADNDIEIDHLAIIFSNGDWQSFDSNLTFTQGIRSKVITLYGWRRHVRAIQFAYRAIGNWTNGPTAVQVYGLGRGD